MKTVPRVILIGILLVLSIIAVLPVSAGRSLSPTVFQSGIDTPTLPPVASNTPEPAATNTPEPAATNTPVPAATSTVVPPATPTLVPPTLPPPVYTIIAYWTVQPGQTLYCIGRYYKVSPWAIASANRIPWPYYLYLGQVIAIPNVPWYNIPPGPVCYPGTPNITPTPPGFRLRHHRRPTRQLQCRVPAAIATWCSGVKRSRALRGTTAQRYRPSCMPIPASSIPT